VVFVSENDDASHGAILIQTRQQAGNPRITAVSFIHRLTHKSSRVCFFGNDPISPSIDRVLYQQKICGRAAVPFFDDCGIISIAAVPLTVVDVAVT